MPVPTRSQAVAQKTRVALYYIGNRFVSALSSMKSASVIFAITLADEMWTDFNNSFTVAFRDELRKKHE